MTIRHLLQDFDKATGVLSQEWPITAQFEAEIPRILRVRTKTLTAVDPCKLTPDQAERIGQVIGRQITAQVHDYFVQAFDEQGIASARQSAVAE